MLKNFPEVKVSNWKRLLTWTSSLLLAFFRSLVAESKLSSSLLKQPLQRKSLVLRARRSQIRLRNFSQELLASSHLVLLSCTLVGQAMKSCCLDPLIPSLVEAINEILLFGPVPSLFSYFRLVVAAWFLSFLLPAFSLCCELVLQAGVDGVFDLDLSRIPYQLVMTANSRARVIANTHLVAN